MNRSRSRLVGVLAGLLAPLLAGCQCCCPRECVEAPTAVAPLPIVQMPPLPSAETQVFVDVEIYRVAAGKLPADTSSTLTFHDGGGVTSRLSKADAAELRARLTKGPGVEVVAMPKILALAGQEATIFTGETIGLAGAGRAGVEGPSFSVDGDDWIGFRARVVATPSPDGANVSIDFSFAARESVKNGETFDRAAIKASESAARIEKLSVLSGDTAVVWGADSAKARLFVLVTPTILRPDAAAKVASVPPAPPAAAPLAPAPPPAPTNVDAWKGSKVTLAFENQPLRDVLKAIATTGNVQLAVSPSVKDVPVTIDVKDQDVATVLTALGKDRFRWVVENYGIVRITPLDK